MSIVPTTASAWDAVGAWAAQVRHVPELRFVNRYHDDASYIEALAQRVLSHWQTNGRGDRLVLSFHGVPRRLLVTEVGLVKVCLLLFF